MFRGGHDGCLELVGVGVVVCSRRGRGVYIAELVGVGGCVYCRPAGGSPRVTCLWSGSGIARHADTDVNGTLSRSGGACVPWRGAGGGSAG